MSDEDFFNWECRGCKTALKIPLRSRLAKTAVCPNCGRENIVPATRVAFEYNAWTEAEKKRKAEAKRAEPQPEPKAAPAAPAAGAPVEATVEMSLEDRYFDALGEVFRLISPELGMDTFFLWWQVVAWKRSGEWARMPASERLREVERVGRTARTPEGMARRVFDRDKATRALGDRFIGLQDEYGRALGERRGETRKEIDSSAETAPPDSAEETPAAEQTPLMDEAANRRQFPRIPADLVASLRKSVMVDLGPDREALIRNLSGGGAMIETDSPFEAGDLIQFDLTLPRETHITHVAGIVRWIKKAAPRAIGVQFIKLSRSEGAAAGKNT
jgi:hypothetical protein